MKTKISILLIGLMLAGFSTAQASNIILLPPAPVSFWQKVKMCTWHLSCYRIFGSTITTINATDRISDSRSTINTNFANLNADKIENASSSIAAITTLSNLISIGTITTGVWNGTPVTVAYGGTGSTTLSANQVLLGNGTGVLKTVVGFGASGQFLTSNGAATAPTWQTSSIDQGAAYTWTGAHIFNTATTTFNATTSIAATTNSPLRLNGTNFAINNGGQTASSTTLVTNGSGSLSWGVPQIAVGATSTNPGFVGEQVITHGLGRVPSFIRVDAQANTDDGGTVCFARSMGIATSTNSSQYAMSQCRANAATGGTTQVQSATSLTGKILRLIDAAGNYDVVADLSAVTATTFTINYTTYVNSGVMGATSILWEAY